VEKKNKMLKGTFFGAQVEIPSLQEFLDDWLAGVKGFPSQFSGSWTDQSSAAAEVQAQINSYNQLAGINGVDGPSQVSELSPTPESYATQAWTAVKNYTDAVNAYQAWLTAYRNSLRK
jgi:hypothetical protein